MNPKNVIVDIRRCHCSIYYQVLGALGFIISQDDPNANLIWWDGSIPVDKFNDFKPNQHANKIPAMDFLCYKSTFFTALNQMKSLFPTYYTFFPKTYILPYQYQEFEKEHQKVIGRFSTPANRKKYYNSTIPTQRNPTAENNNRINTSSETKETTPSSQPKSPEVNNLQTKTAEVKPPTPPDQLKPEFPTWIVKPHSGCCGAGIRLIQSSYELLHDSTPSIVQQYITPFLVEGHKFDFRLYLLITNLQPLTLYIYNEGLARFCTEKYKPPTRKNLSDKFVHITNTAINIENQSQERKDFVFTRLASDVFKSIEEIDKHKGGVVLWDKIKRISMLTILALYPQIVSSVASVCGYIDEFDYLYRDSSYQRRKSMLGLPSLATGFKTPVKTDHNVSFSEPLNQNSKEDGEPVQPEAESDAQPQDDNNSEQKTEDAPTDETKPKEKPNITSNPFHRFFHILGIDIMINQDCEPIVLELNDNPSMKITFAIERNLKKKLLEDAISLVTLDGSVVPIESLENNGFEQIIPFPQPNENTKSQTKHTSSYSMKRNNSDQRDLNSLMRSILQRSMNVFGSPPTTKMMLRAHQQRPVTSKPTDDRSILKKSKSVFTMDSLSKTNSVQSPNYSKTRGTQKASKFVPLTAQRSTKSTDKFQKSTLLPRQSSKSILPKLSNTVSSGK